MTASVATTGSPRGITGYGVYLPRLRLERSAIFAAHAWANPSLKSHAKGVRTACAFDEDPITMAVEACRGLEGTGPRRLLLASTTFPFADRQNAGIVALALDLAPQIATMDVSGSQRASTTALIDVLVSSIDRALVIGSERRICQPASVLEMTSGDGAAAIATGSGRDVIAAYVSHASVSHDFVDHYRMSAVDHDYVLEDRWKRDEGYGHIVPDAVGQALKAANITAEAVDYFLMPTPNAALGPWMAKELGLRASAVADPLIANCGETGAAHALILLAAALEKAGPDQTILLVGFGSGCDAIVLRTTAAITGYKSAKPLSAALTQGRSDSNYMRFLSSSGQIQLDWGLRAERDDRTAQTTAWRKSRDVYAFVGGHCTKCGTNQFPKTNVCVNPNCRATGTQEPERFAETTGRIKTFTEDWQAYTLDPPLQYGNIAFDGGGNVLMEIADAAPGDLSIGLPMTMAFRIKDHDTKREFRRYFWKAVPVAGGA